MNSTRLFYWLSIHLLMLLITAPAWANPCNSLPCFNDGACFSDDDAYLCSCPAGWTGAQCEILASSGCSRSATVIRNPCMNFGRCDEVGDSYTCTCRRGYAGTHCEIAGDINECDSNPCVNNG